MHIPRVFMLSNYTRIALRNMARQKGYSFINIFGLAVGMAAFVLISLFVVAELGMDKHHPDVERTYQVQLDAVVGEQTILTASSPAIMAPTFRDAYPEIETAVRVNTWSGSLVTSGDVSFIEPVIHFADSTVFDIFAIDLVRGDAADALTSPFSIILSEETATKYFGDRDALGQTLRIDDENDYEVTGVFRRDVRSAHFDPVMVASFHSLRRAGDTEWLNNSFETYLKFRNAAAVPAFQARMPDAVRMYVADRIQEFFGTSFDDALASGFRYDWKLQPVSDIYLRNEAEDQLGRLSDIRYVYILAAIAAFILLIACINFMNLATARAAGRAREVGLRKVMGSDRRQLMRQFLGESTLTAFVSMLLAVGLVLLAIPAFNGLAQVDLQFVWWLPAMMLGTALVTGLVAGSYPAFVLSSFEPAEVLKGSVSGGGRGGVRFRAALVVFQFAISITLVVSTLVVYRQIAFIQDRELGFSSEQLVVLPLHTREGWDRFESFRSTVLQHPSIVNAAKSSIMPGQNRIHNNTGFKIEGMPPDEMVIAMTGNVSFDYVETMGLSLVAGRDFDPARPADSTAWVINEEAARHMGYEPADIIGKHLYQPDPEREEQRGGPIIGVLRNANYESLHLSVRPMILSGQGWARYVPVRVDAGSLDRVLPVLREAYASLEPAFPFDYYFADEDFMALHAQEVRLGKIYTIFSVLAILIACLGLFGLASFVTTRRTKEIGVRKVLGASAMGVLVLLSREFTLLVGVAAVVAFPVAWLIMNRWLEGFAYRTEMSWWIFAAAGVLAIVIAWVTVGYQALRAARLNPAEAIRHE